MYSIKNSGVSNRAESIVEVCDQLVAINESFEPSRRRRRRRRRAPSWWRCRRLRRSSAATPARWVSTIGRSSKTGRRPQRLLLLLEPTPWKDRNIKQAAVATKKKKLGTSPTWTLETERAEGQSGDDRSAQGRHGADEDALGDVLGVHHRRRCNRCRRESRRPGRRRLASSSRTHASPAAIPNIST